MLKSVSFLVFLCIVLSVSAGKRSWRESKKPLDRTRKVGFYLTLPQRDIEGLKRQVELISNPDHFKYGKYLTKEQVGRYTNAPLHMRNKAMLWVRTECPASHIFKIEDIGDAIKVDASVDCVEKLFKVKMQLFQVEQLESIRLSISSGLPSVPSFLGVERVMGLDMLPVLRQKKKALPASQSANIPGTNQFISIEQINRVYHIESNKIHRGDQAVVEFGEGSPSLSDLQNYDQWSNIPFSNISRIVGPWDNNGNDGESLLDIQLITAVAQEGSTTYITIEYGWIYEMASTLFTLKNTPLIASVSYGFPESLTCEVSNCQTDAQAYVVRSESELAKLAALGVTVIVCSQDEGAPSEQNEFCSLDDTHPLWPIYPGTSAYALSVSATTLLEHRPESNLKSSSSKSQANTTLKICLENNMPCGDGAFEAPCMYPNTNFGWTTGGGFSNYIERPKWQDAAVSEYINTTALPPAKYFNVKGRAYPDISAFGSRILVVNNGAISASAGTSASTPIIAGILTLVNSDRISKGGKPLGFFNPLLYKMYDECRDCFTSVSTGSNKWSRSSTECKYGYNAAAGYDAVTGVGTPKLDAILRYLDQKLK